MSWGSFVILRENQPEAARNLAQRAVELGLDDTTVWGVIALANRDLADYENAQLAADRAIAHDPRNARAYIVKADVFYACLLYTSPSPRDRSLSRMPSSA